MNRSAMEAAVYRDFGYASSPASAISTRVQAYLNDRHRRLLTLPGTEIFRRETGPAVTLTASTSTYTLNMPVQKVLRVTDTTNDRVLEERDLNWYRRVEPDPTAASGTQEFWIPLRWGPALRDVGGSGLWAASTSASDTTQAVNVETIDTNGSVTQTNATLTGATRVQIGTATNHQRLLRFSLSATAVGVVSLYDASSGGNEVSRITLGRTDARFITIALWPTPAAADSIVVDYVHYIRDFSGAYDEPQLPTDFHYLVVLGTKIDEATKKDDATRRTEWIREYERGVAELIHFVALQGGDSVIVPGELAGRGRSNLGGAYPPGIW